MSEVNYQALREIAKQATQGDWRAFISSDTGTYAVHTPGYDRCDDIIKWPGFDGQENAENNARYIAAFNPKVVLALLDVLDASLEREQIRHEHAKWSDSTFGCVGPIGPLKHLSKEALEAAAEPDDLSEWADMQFLLWDAQRRAGISDAEITAAMEDKLKINMERQWPEPKDGEPRLHIKEPGNSPVIPDGWVMVPKELTPEMMRAVQIRSELGGYATSNLSGAYNMFSEFWNVAVSAAPKVDDL